MAEVLNTSRRLPEIDGLRGLAIWMAVFTHYNWLPAGSSWMWIRDASMLFDVSMDIFFALSGFLLGGILIENRNSKKYYQVFYLRRFLRIWPLYLVLLGAYCAIKFGGWIEVLNFERYFQNEIPLQYYFLTIQNMLFAKYETQGPLFLSVTWSIAIEEQFYFLLPFLIRIVNQSYLPKVLAGLILFSPIFRMAVFSMHPKLEWNNFVSYIFLMPSRWDSLFGGVLVAYLYAAGHLHFFYNKYRFYFRSFFVFLGIGIMFLTKLKALYGWPAMLVLAQSWIACFCCMLIAMLLAEEFILKKFFSFRLLRQAGTISYFMYLFHFPILCFFYAFFLKKDFPVIADPSCLMAVAAALLVTVTLASLSWVFIERPLIRYGHGFSYRT